MTGTADEGTYTLLVELPEAATVEVGALGERQFAAGWYAYTGSAFGPGGFARVERHRELAAGERDARHWHVDYLLGHPQTRLDAVVRTPGEDVECAVSRALSGEDDPEGDDTDGDPDEWTAEPVSGFGASDCDCGAHLVYAAEGDRLRRAVERAHGASG